MKCTGCQQAIEGLAFETPQGPLCIDCRAFSLREKRNHPWLAFFTDVLICLAMYWALVSGLLGGME